MGNKRKRIFITAIVFSLFIIGVVVALMFAFGNRKDAGADKIALNESTVPSFTADISSIHGNSPQEITFLFKTSGEADKVNEAYVYEHESGEIICQLERQEDCFVGTATISGNPGEVATYNTNLSDYSEAVKISFYDEVKDSDVDDLVGISKELQEISAKFADSEGYTEKKDYDKALNYVYKEVEVWQKTGKIKDVFLGSESVCITTNAGLDIIYMPKIKGLKAGGGESRLGVYCFFPYYNEEGFSDAEYPDKLLDVLSDNVLARMVKSPTTFKEASVNPKSIGDYFTKHSYIVWSSHGYKDEKSNTGIYLELGDYENVVDLYEDKYNWAGIEFLSDKNAGGYVTPMAGAKFFNMALNDGDLDDSLLYLGACHSGEDSSLSQVFLNKGASMVVGYSDKVGVEYDSYIFKRFTEKMFDYRNDEKMFPTVEESMRYAIAEEPEDSVTKAKFVYCGDLQYRFFNEPVTSEVDQNEKTEFEDELKETGILKSDTSDIRLELDSVIVDATPQVYSFNYVYNGYKNNEIVGDLTVADYTLFGKSDDEAGYSDFSYFIADTDNDSYPELYVNLISDVPDFIFGLPQKRLHVYEIVDNDISKIQFSEIRSRWGEQGFPNFDFTVYNDKIYIKTYLEGDDLPVGDNILYLECTIKEGTLDIVSYSDSLPDDVPMQ